MFSVTEILQLVRPQMHKLWAGNQLHSLQYNMQYYVHTIHPEIIFLLGLCNLKCKITPVLFMETALL